MPTIDETRGVLVIRIVYDGPALSGKTTSLQALAQGVASAVECPEERDGRTLYFDWMEYVGGLFEGRQISCQIVSVPGQRDLAHRRKVLLESADAVVCVLDTRRPELEFGLSWLHEVMPYCRAESPPVGIVLQANKRDASDAVPRAELRERVGSVAQVAIVESVATVSDGIREAFVLAVRLALDRVRALSSEGKLRARVPNERSADDLLRTLRKADAESDLRLSPLLNVQDSDPLHAVLDQPLPDVAGGGQREQDPERVFVPDPMMPGGMIWPPVDGRALLHEVASLKIMPARTARGDWWGSGAGWRFHSGPRALYSDHNVARNELIGWARLHAANAKQISTGRAVILADAGAGRMRLWQLVRVEPVLRERLDAALSASDARAVASGLIDVASQLLAAQEWFANGTVTLPCTLWSVSVPRTPHPCYTGLMPDLGVEQARELAPHALLERELVPHLRELRRARVEYAEVRRELMMRSESSGPDSALRKLAEVVRAMD